jgi:polyisoprenoid-binding protein YceI
MDKVTTLNICMGRFHSRDARSVALSAIIVFSLFIIFTNAGSTAGAAEIYSVDGQRSTATFSIRKLGVANIAGSFSDISGTVVFDKENPADDSFDITVGVASLNTHSERRDKLMRSADFFDVEKHPKLSFKSAKVRKTKDGRYEATGDFSLHGVKKIMTIVFEVAKEREDPTGGRQLVLKTQFAIKRSEYGIKKDIPVIGDKVKIALVIDSVRK